MWHTVIGIAILIALVIAGIPLARRNKRAFKAHNDEMQSWARTHGYNYAFEDGSQCDGLSFYPFGQSSPQYAHRVITGKYDERTIAAYDFYFSTGGSTTGGGGDTYFAMIVMQLPAEVPWLHVTERKNLGRHADENPVITGDEAFDSVYAVFAGDPAYAKSAVSASVRSGLPAQSLSGMHVVDSRLFFWQTRRKHDVALLDDRLRFAATVAAELPATH
ncbi:MAG TPA: hypothetical protein VHW74_08165 [Mycobacteriales bacterium]|jgi:hypothetical protein|nr:hypothetical protein [Mycobacteriales bacterium]